MLDFASVSGFSCNCIQIYLEFHYNANVLLFKVFLKEPTWRWSRDGGVSTPHIFTSFKTKKFQTDTAIPIRFIRHNGLFHFHLFIYLSLPIYSPSKLHTAVQRWREENMGLTMVTLFYWEKENKLGSLYCQLLLKKITSSLRTCLTPWHKFCKSKGVADGGEWLRP